MLTERKCSTCKEVKPISSFNKNKGRLEGFSYECRECKALYAKNNYPDGFQVLCMNCQFIKKVEKGEVRHA